MAFNSKRKVVGIGLFALALIGCAGFMIYTASMLQSHEVSQTKSSTSVSQAQAMTWEGEGLLLELTREGIDYDKFGFDGRLVSAMRAEEVLPEDDFEKLREWVRGNVEWTVMPVDRERSIEKVIAVVPIVAKGSGQMGEEYETAAVFARFIVIYGVGGQFPGIQGYRLEGPPFVVFGIMDNKYDWREARCEGEGIGC